MTILIILLAGVLTWAARASFIVAGARWEPSPFAERVIQNARHAVIAALAVSALLAGGDGDIRAIPLEWLVASVVALAVAYRWRSLGGTILAGMCALWSVTLLTTALG